MSFLVIIIVRALVVLVAAIAISAIFGHETHLTDWHGGIGMAYPTAACFIIVSVALLLLTTRKEP